RFENPDHVDLNVGFLYNLLDIPLGVPAVVLATVRDDEQRFAVRGSLSHLAETQIDGIEQGRLTARLDRDQAILQVLVLGRKSRNELKSLAEVDQQELVLGIRGLEELRDGFPGFL